MMEGGPGSLDPLTPNSGILAIRDIQLPMRMVVIHSHQSVAPRNLPKDLEVAQRELPDLLRCCQGAEEVGEAVGQNVLLEAHRVGGQTPAGQPGPADGDLSCL